MLDALEDKELNFRFDESRLLKRRFNRTLNRLRNIFDKERKEIIEQEKYYGQMLDHVKTGIIVIDEDGKVNYCNNAALGMLGLMTFSHIRQLKAVSESLFETFQSITESAEERASYYNESGKKTISLTASNTILENKTVKIIAFNDISDKIAENEQLSWSRLIRVLTHEIMNTVTPIASLSDTLLTFDNVDDEVRNGLDTISQSSRGLIRFVESYRNLTRVAPPVKRAFFVKDLVERVLHLTATQAEKADATCRYIEKSEDILLYADENQISQILVNLIKNAIQADADTITISAEIDSHECVIIDVTNNGAPISEESQKEIFIPFFTTKQEGTGIGLSLSRQIMQLHNGTIHLSHSDMDGTTFTLKFK
jgi:PAS domain S-box-containing protein